MQVSRRVQDLSPSATLALNQKAKALQSDGKSVINLTVGEPDLPTPQRICNAAIQALEKRETRYTASTGIVQLKDAIIQVAKATYGRSYSRTEVIVSAGVKNVLYNLCQATLNPGDEAIIFSPYWVSYADMVKMAQGEPVIIPTREEDSFEPSLKSLEKGLTSKTRLVFLNSPSNPTGAVMSQSTIEGLANLLRKHPKVLVVTDDIYEKFLFDHQKFYSIGMVRGFPTEQLVIAHGVSKSYSMTGFRIGFALAPKELVSAMEVIQSNSISNATSIAQWASVEALLGPQEDVSKMRSIFEARRDQFYPEVTQPEGVTCFKPAGAFYFFPNLKKYIGKKQPSGKKVLTDVDLAEYLLTDFGLAVVPGSAFGAPGFLRFSFAASNEELQEGTNRFQKGLKALQSI